MQYPYRKLSETKKADIINMLIPLIDKAVKINECWIDDNDGRHPTIHSFDELGAASSLWAALRDLHDDFR